MPVLCYGMGKVLWKGELAMTIADTLLPEFDHEMATTRKTLERVPEDQLAWRPHPKSWTLAELATHLANIPAWIPPTLETDSLDIGAVPHAPLLGSAQALLEAFDRNVAAARTRLAGAPDQKLLHPWTALAVGQPLFSMPRIAVLRSFVLSHSIHHRAQLGMYLRLNDIPVPSTYGPTADETNG